MVGVDRRIDRGDRVGTGGVLRPSGRGDEIGVDRGHRGIDLRGPGRHQRLRRRRRRHVLRVFVLDANDHLHRGVRSVGRGGGNLLSKALVNGNQTNKKKVISATKRTNKEHCGIAPKEITKKTS